MRTSKMKNNESIIRVFEIKRQIDLAKVRIMTTHLQGPASFRTSFESKARIPVVMQRAYWAEARRDTVDGQS